jgi:hypothetical protein
VFGSYCLGTLSHLSSKAGAQETRVSSVPARSEPVRTQAHRAIRAPTAQRQTDKKLKNRLPHSQ